MQNTDQNQNQNQIKPLEQAADPIVPPPVTDSDKLAQMTPQQMTDLNTQISQKEKEIEQKELELKELRLKNQDEIKKMQSDFQLLEEEKQKGIDSLKKEIESMKQQLPQPGLLGFFNKLKFWGGKSIKGVSSLSSHLQKKKRSSFKDRYKLLEEAKAELERLEAEKYGKNSKMPGGSKKNIKQKKTNKTKRRK
jgi:hypothetical protein